jgi:hypothetical protein
MREYAIQHIITHWNKELSLRIKQTNNLICKLLTVMSPEKETKFGITFGQVYLVISLLLTFTVTIGAAWTNINSRITALEVNKTTLEFSIRQDRTENREDHKLIGEKLDKNNETLNLLIGVVNNKTKIAARNLNNAYKNN